MRSPVESLFGPAPGGDIALSAVSSSISVGTLGGGQASYTTLAGDTYADIFSHLDSSLSGLGISVEESGVNLIVLSNISDDTTLAGAVEFATTDPGLTFAVQVGSVPEPSGFILLGIGTLCLIGYVARRRRGLASPSIPSSAEAT
jgi:hypothetical protein